MQIEQIENFLRRSPKVAAPAELLERLRSDIKLAAVQSVHGDARRTTRQDNSVPYGPSFFKRWLPALSVAVWLLACLVILAVQSNMLQRLKVENRVARAAAAFGDPQVQASAPDAELARLRAEAEEARKLRAEIAQLSSQLSEAQKIRAENQGFSITLRNPMATTAPAQDFFSEAAEKEQLMECVTHLKQVGLGARMWANEHKTDVLPTAFDQMESELPNKAVLFCPASGGTVQYELISPGAPENDPNIVYIRCPRHNAVGLTDGSVQRLGKNLRVVARPDGKMVIGH